MVNKQKQNKTKRNTHMNDPLAFAVDLGGKVDTTPPVPIAGSHVVELAGVEVKENKKQNGNNLILTFKLVNAVAALPGKDGSPRQCNPGFTYNEYLPLQQSENPNAPDYRVKICRIFDALAGTDDSTRPGNLPFGTLIGKQCIIVTEPKQEEGYGLVSRIKQFNQLS